MISAVNMQDTQSPENNGAIRGQRYKIVPFEGDILPMSSEEFEALMESLMKDLHVYGAKEDKNHIRPVMSNLDHEG